MVKRPALLRVAENLVLMHLNDKGGFKVLDVIIGLHLLVQLARADRRKEACIAHRDTNT